MVKLIRNKDEVAQIIQNSIAALTTKFGWKPKAFRSDNGKEYITKDLQQFFKREGIQYQTTVPYTPQQNGVAERKNRALTEMCRCMLLDAGLDKKYWGEVILTATYLQNRLPSRSVEKTPYELFHGHKPDLRGIRVFGSKVYAHIPKQKRRKLDDVAREGILMGYEDTKKGYRKLDPVTEEVWVER